MKRLIAILLTLSLCVALLPFVNTVEAASYSYNSGQRNSTCTQLTSAAKAYYTGSYTYSTLSGQTSSTLKSNLKTLMTSTHSTLTSYDGLRTLTAYSDTNCSNTSQILLFYTNDSVSSTWDSGSTWNREHIWPQSLGTFTTSNAGSDLHHLRPADPTVNSTRGNKPYGEVSGGTTVKRNATGTIAGTYSSTYYEPNDNVKGDVARILLYVYVRWNETNLTDVIQSTTVLLDWMELDPVDDWEMQRNDIVQSIQGNRNVFIDYPEYAWLIFGQSVPSNLVSPSSGGSSSATATPTTTSGATATPTATSGSGTGTTYNLVTSASSLSAGDTVVIVGVRSAGTVWALGTTQNSNNRAAVQLTDYSSMQSTIEISNDSVAKLTLGGSSGAWTFYDSVNSGYLYAASSSANYLKTQSSASTAANWAISFSSGVASVVSQGSYTRNTMQLNSSSALFSCYSSASQSPVYIYKQAGSTSTATPTPVVTATPTPVVTATPTPVVTATPTPVVTATPTPVVTATPTPVVTATPTPVVTATPTPVVTATPTPVVTATPTPVVTATPTPVVTATPTPVVTEAPTAEPTAAAGGEYSLVTAVTAGKQYLIAYNYSGTTYVMTTNYYSSGKYPQAVAATVTANGAGYDIALSSGDDASYRLTAGGNSSSGWTLNNSSAGYLAFNSSGYPVFASSGLIEWTYSAGSLKNTDYSYDSYVYLGFNTSSKYFTYSKTAVSFVLYELNEGGTVTPTAEPTTAPTAEPTTAPTTAPTAEPTTAPSGAEYNLVTSITAGKKYLLVYTSGSTNYAVTTTLYNTSSSRYPRMATASITANGTGYDIDMITTTYGSDEQAFLFTASASGTGWRFYNATKGYLAYDSGGYPTYTTSAGSYAVWTYSSGKLRNTNWTGDSYYYLGYSSSKYLTYSRTGSTFKLYELNEG